MNKLFSYLFIGILLSVSTAAALFLSNYQEPTVININAQQATPTTTVLAKNLEVPWALGFLPDGNLLFTERTGKIKLLNTTTNIVTTVTVIQGIKVQAESGLLGLAVHPQFATNNFVYIYYSYPGAGGTQNRVARYTFSNNQFTNPTTLIDGIPGNDYHNGGRLRFGPDGYLYITTGDGNNLATPQDTNSLGGKILRVTDTGAAAPGNPFNNRIWSYGHRNPQGLAWDGTTLYATEHGPSQPSCCDELNRIEAGKNYGWPDVKGDETKAGTIKNLINSGQDGNNTWAPSGATFYNGSVFFAGLRGQALYEATIQGASATIKTSHFKNQFGRIRDVVIGPDNMLYIATGNKSAQGGSAKPEDDKIIKVAFAGVGGAAPTTVAATKIPAPTNIVPTFGCVSNEPCTTAAPTTTGATPPVGGQNPGPGTPPVGGTNPTPPPGNPGTNPQPCPTDGTASILHKKKKIKSSGGFIEQFIKFILRLIELFLKLIGVSIPNPGQVPTPIPGQPGGSNPEPCPEPTNVIQPTLAIQPSQQPTPSSSIQPSSMTPKPATPAIGGLTDPNTCGNQAAGSGARPVTPKCTINATDLNGASAAKSGDIVCFKGSLNGRLQANKTGVTYSGDGTTTVTGIDVSGEGVTVQGFVVSKGTAPGIAIYGKNNTVQDNKVQGPVSGGDNDGLRFFGDGLKILHNTISNIRPSGGAHADCMQSFATGGRSVATSNTIIDSNRCENVANIGVIMEGPNSGYGDGSCQGKSENITIINNYFDNGSSDAVFVDDIHTVKFINNEIVGKNNAAISFEGPDRERAMKGATVKCNKIAPGIKEINIDRPRGKARCGN